MLEMENDSPQDRRSHEAHALVGNSLPILKLRKLVQAVSHFPRPILIVGETGTGKEVVARAIHEASQSKGPFVAIDCGALPAALMESELFGHEKGAFTGASTKKTGLLVAAKGGTAFFDEIGELPLEGQTRLLRALQEYEVRSLGSTQSIPLEVRVLAATNRDLEVEIKAGAFRKDLYYRLCAISIEVPPLRDHPEDIEALACSWLRDSGRSIGREALRMLREYQWPGNVRELKSCIERSAWLASGKEISAADLPEAVTRQPGNTGQSSLRSGTLADLERAAILSMIDHVNGDKILGARLLGIGKTTLYRKLKEYKQQDAIPKSDV